MDWFSRRRAALLIAPLVLALGVVALLATGDDGASIETAPGDPSTGPAGDGATSSTPPSPASGDSGASASTTGSAAPGSTDGGPPAGTRSATSPPTAGATGPSTGGTERSATTTTPTLPTSTSAQPPATSAPPPPYRSSVQPVAAEDLGSSWTPGTGCTPPEQLRAVSVTHWGDDGGVRSGRIVVHADRADDVAAIFGDLYAARYPITRVVPVDAYGADDQASMRANNTSGYNCRTVAGSSTLSQHAYGLAIDVNPLYNPYVRGSSVDPPEGRPWADRSRQDSHMIHADDEVVRAFAARGWHWGGYWSSGQDYQHFSVGGT